MASRASAYAVAFAVLLVGSSAASAPSPAQRETARRLMDEGKDRTREGDMPRALDAYQKAHDIMHVPSTGIALAKTHVALGHLVEGRDVALEVLRMPREPKEPAAFEHARKAAKELEASLKARIPTVKIVIKGGPATRVTVDDGEVAPILLGEPVAMNPGKHVVVAKNADGVEARSDVDLAERDAKSVEIDLPAAKPQIVFAPSTAPSSRPAPENERGQRTALADVLVFGGFGLATAGLAVGAVSGLMAMSKAGDVKPQCENGICDPSVKGNLDDAKTLATVSTIGFAAAGVGLACGVIGLVLPKGHARISALQSPSAHAAMVVGPNGVLVRGSF
jgi:hypothetical protein